MNIADLKLPRELNRIENAGCHKHPNSKGFVYNDEYVEGRVYCSACMDEQANNHYDYPEARAMRDQGGLDQYYAEMAEAKKQKAERWKK